MELDPRWGVEPVTGAAPAVEPLDSFQDDDAGGPQGGESASGGVLGGADAPSDVADSDRRYPALAIAVG